MESHQGSKEGSKLTKTKANPTMAAAWQTDSMEARKPDSSSLEKFSQEVAAMRE